MFSNGEESGSAAPCSSGPQQIILRGTFGTPVTLNAFSDITLLIYPGLRLALRHWHCGLNVLPMQAAGFKPRISL